jgi:hypothetical protein
MAVRHKERERYRTANLECARIIAADPVRYPGIMRERARLVLKGSARTTPAVRRAA